ncbi:ABC transporter ATP-binding protein [Actinopolymorpha sp. B17G11]|uniref:ABC transporter ATP-binding protein n=1 Tax=Actinopolymorpha sp. B17G11 TaxID=3160861 RepID=UPI0032E3D238
MAARPAAGRDDPAAGHAHLESPELTDELTMARDFDLGIAAPPLSYSLGMIAAGLVHLVVGLAQVGVLSAYAWWAAVLVGGAWASTHWLLRPGTLWDRNTGEALAAERRAEYAYRLAAAPPAAKEVRLFGLSEWVVAQFAASRSRLVELRWQAMRLRPLPTWTTVGLLVGTNGIVMWSLARDLASATVGIGEAVVFAQAAMGASALAFGGLNWSLPYIAQDVAAVLGLGGPMAAAGKLLAAPAPDPRGVRSSPRRARQIGSRTGVRVALHDVRFRYPGHRMPVLDGVDLTVQAGESVAIVGLNGAGKTTLVKLLCRLYDPTEGRIAIDGVDLRQLDIDAWRQDITAVFQDFIRYELPVRDNVAPTGATEDAVEAALAAAGAAGIAGLDTVLSPRYANGTDLSGGQWQRIALARALCAVENGAGLVILDEPTAQLDVRGEAEVFDRILTAVRGRCTTLLISHRFSTVRHADRICVLERGKVAEVGTHDELVGRGGRYRQLYDLQASRFATDGGGVR